jgi:peptidoglycan/xylan/chitin deacetylase (PgdA/CDA1 family)
MPALPPLALAYHGVSIVPFAADRFRLFVAPAQVERDIALLRAWGYELVTFAALARRARDGDGTGAAALTFDDGLADNWTALAPILTRHAAPATVFVVTDWLGGVHPDAPGAAILNAAQVRHLHQAGVEIGAHGTTHADLTTLSPAAATADLARSRHVLEALVDAPVASAAYPYGAADAGVRAACRAAGFVAACRTSGQGRWDDPFDLPRQAMGHGASVVGLRLKRRDLYEPLMRVPGVPALRRWSRRTHSVRASRRAAPR